MPRADELAALTQLVSRQADSGKALEQLTQKALEMTGSRNVLIACMNDELGVLEMRYGAGADWTAQRLGKFFHIDVKESAGIVAHVAATAESFVTGDVSEEPIYQDMFSTTKSEIAVPILDTIGRVRGVLNAESDNLDAYSEDHLIACQIIADLISLVFEREEHLMREEALIAVGSAMDQAQNEKELLSQVIEVAQNVLRFQAFSIFLYDAETDKFVLRASLDQLKDKIGSLTYKRGEGCTGWVCEHGEPLRLDQPQKDPRWRGANLEFPSEQVASFIAVPISIRSHCIGAVRVIRRKSDNEYLDNRFTEGEQQVIQAVADQIAIGIENIRTLEKTLHSERMIAWGEMSAKSSHMIGNRVFALKGDVNELKHLLGEEVLARKSLQDLQASLSTNVTRVDEILQDFRDFLTATKIAKVSTDIPQLVRETATEVFPRRSRIELVLDIDETLPEIETDSKRIRRALSELIENSISFMDEGSLRISANAATKRDVIDANLSPLKPFIKIEVRDTGPGVTDDKKAKIFEPFFSSRVRGMGLGLSIVKGILEAHGGTVVETGQEGEGANFMMLLPVGERQNGEEK
ncbi:MAG: GAF domain-containing protein [Fimbriimonadaceae bacterium]|nr:GAF domain-containing protein [Fimbriimonadaceae bacterium]